MLRAQERRGESGERVRLRHILRQRVRDIVARRVAAVSQPEGVRYEFRHDHRVAAPENPRLAVHRHPLLAGDGQEEKIVADPPHRDVPRPETAPEGDPQHNRIHFERDARKRLRLFRTEHVLQGFLAFIAEFVHSIENRKKWLVSRNCFQGKDSA
ncbi:hypothetical protein SDC9_163339 [bioreactor metagenome]|uniref:Uncharacterized protein n=1 Tax=bioreactor metagenome TaxID=1076179 RepID=A0A645FQV8_9ZZZZ